MTQLLEQAFAAATKLSQDKQDELAQLILEEVARQHKIEPQKKPRMLKPVAKGSDFTDTSINHDAALAEYIFVTISSSQ